MKIKELEQLYDISTKCYDELLHVQKQHIDELTRLNNIINELEKYCKEERATSQYVHECNAYNDVLMKLKELKGSDKE